MKKSVGVIILAIVVELLAFPLLMIEGKYWPANTCIMVIDAWTRIENSVWWQLYHHLKNLMTELFRCDPQWWSKFSLSMLSALVICNLILVVWIIVLKKKRD